jgi:uncharacterized membrane protein
MESKARLLGHPIHPMLIVFPLGLLTTALVFDIVYLATGNAGFATVSFWNIAAGVIGGLLAAVFGLVDWLAIPRHTRAKTIGLCHAVGNVVVLGLFIVSWLLRRGEPGHAPSIAAFVLAVIAVALAAVTGWLGGELVGRLGIGVYPGANPDASSSLSGRSTEQPAGAAARPRGPAAG